MNKYAQNWRLKTYTRIYNSYIFYMLGEVDVIGVASLLSFFFTLHFQN